MKQGWKKVITLMLAFALVISVMPAELNWMASAKAESTETTATAAYGYVTADGVKVRRQPSTSSVYWFKVDTGFVVEILGVEEKGGITWYHVNSTHPNNNGRTYIGFIHGDFFKVMTAEEVAQWKSGNAAVSGSTGTAGSTGSAPVATAAPNIVNGYVQLILSSANLRNEPAGDVVMQWETKGEILPYYGSPIAKGKFTWYNVEYGGLKYYVRNDCVQTVTAEGMPVTAAPAATPAPSTVTGYVITTKGGVNLRLKPAGETITQVDKNVVVPCVGDKVTSGGYDWYNVNYNGMRGYLRGDCVAVCNADGSTSGVVQQPSTGVTTTEPVVYGYVKMTVQGVNLRNSPAGRSQEQLDQNLVVPVIGATVTSGKYTWYPVKAPSGTMGYVRGDCVAVCNADGTTEGATLAPGAVPSLPTNAPTTGTTVSTYGYIQLTKSGVNLRETIAGKTLTQLDKGTVWPLIASVQTVNNVTWYPVKANNYTGFVRGDCAFKLSATQEQSYLAGNGVPSEDATPAPAISTYLKTVVAAVNLRASASKDAKAEFNVPLGTVMAYNETTTAGGSTWYRVVYQNKEVWVLGSCVAVMTDEEYKAYIAANPNNTPQPEVAVGYLKATMDDVNIRSTAGGSKILTRVNKDVVMPFLATPTTARNYTWYLVKAPDGQRGYIRSDCIVICNSDGSELSGGSSGGSSSTGQEATYTTLRLGSTGEEVEKLVTELRSQGYYSGEIVSTYNSDVQKAVTAFQKDKGLSADGIAGPATQHALFGTIPEGSGTGDLTMTLYPAEKIDWFTGGIQQLMPKGANFKVYDVKTGIVWWAHRWSGFNHADIETLTAADTARLCKIYGVSSADQITNKNGHWVRRPCLVTIGERTFACSLYGVPHNEKGDTIADNNMTGQICLHFTNSRTSDTDILDADHQEAIDYAWKNAPNGHK